MFGRGRRLWEGALLLCVTIAAYLPALRGGFIWDDDTFLTRNPLMRAGDGLYRFWFTTQAPDYFPVTYSPLWLEWRLWGVHPAGYHLVNLGLHLAAVLLLWAVLSGLRLRCAFVAAFIYAVHPVNVESVAWITQRKNLMAMLFFLLSILSFIRSGPFQDPGPGSPPGGGSRRPVWAGLGASLIFFALGMLSKGSIAPLPLVLLGLVAWRRPVRSRDIALVLPFFAVSATLVLTDIWFQKHGAAEVFRNAGLPERLLGAGGVIWFYLSKALFPFHLLFIYPQWEIRVGDPRWWLPLAAVVGFTALLWHGRRGPARAALFAWGYFCACLVPVLGFTDVQFMQYSLVADHYGQLALIGVIVFACHAWGDWGRRFHLPGIAAATVVCLFAFLTWRQCGTYRDAETLYRATLERNPGCWLAHNNLGGILYRAGRVQEAIAHYDAALRLKPDLFEAQNDLGLALTETGRLPEAVAHFERALRIHPDNAAVYYNEATALAGAGRPGEAVPRYERALQLRPRFAEAQHDLGAALMQLGRLPEAVPHFEEALRLRPGYFEAHANLGTALARLGRPDGALEHFAAACRIRPNDAPMRNNLGCALAQAGRAAEARAQFEEALRIDPGSPDARANLARLPPPP
jgi:tetratricopeptide (TPR) repeat protein